MVGVKLCCAFYQPLQLCKDVEPKPFSWTKLECFDFTSSNFNLQGHILCTSGVSLKTCLQRQFVLWNGWAFAVMLGKVPNEPIKASHMMQNKRMGNGQAIPWH